MKKLFPLFLAMLLCSYGSRGQNFERLEWSRVRMDSTWNTPEGRAAEIIGKYRPTIDSLMIPIGRTAEEMESYAPESPLSNLAADIMFEFASDYLKKSTGERDAEVDMAMTNFGGIRASLPGGDVTAYDVMSIFPFDNKIVILDLEGRYVRELLESSVRLMDGKSPLEVELPGPVNLLKKPLLKAVKGTVIEKVLRDHGVLKEGM